MFGLCQYDRKESIVKQEHNQPQLCHKVINNHKLVIDKIVNFATLITRVELFSDILLYRFPNTYIENKFQN